MTTTTNMDKIRELHRGVDGMPAAMLKDLLLMFAEANGGRSVPTCMLYHDGPGEFDRQFDEPLPYIWSKLDSFLKVLNDPSLNAIVADYGMCGDD